MTCYVLISSVSKSQDSLHLDSDLIHGFCYPFHWLPQPQDLLILLFHLSLSLIRVKVPNLAGASVFGFGLIAVAVLEALTLETR